MKLSVMMVTYNHERFIAQALASVLAQRVNFDYEIVVGEDCSTDRTRDILMDFHRRYPGRIVPLLRNPNMGAARNAAATRAACRGQYLAILEGDDYWTSEDKLQRQVDFLDAHPDHAVCCARAQLVDEIRGGQSSIYPAIPVGSYTIADLFETNWIVTCTVMYRWGSVAALPAWFTEMTLGDWPLHVLVAQSGKIHLMDEVMAVYRLHSGSVWASMANISQLQDIVRMLAELDEYLQFKYTHLIRRTLARSYLDMAFLARMDGDRRQAAKYLLPCLSNGGWQLPDSRRMLAGLAAYVLIGSRYKIFSRAKEATHAKVATQR